MSLEILDQDMPVIAVHPQVSEVLKEIDNQASNPPGGDRYMANFYKAIGDLGEKDSRIRQLLSNVLSERDISTKHIANLLFRSIQYIELYEIKNPDYPKHLSTQEEWEREIGMILSNYLPTLKNILMTRETGTTIYQRYAGPKFVISTFLSDAPLKIADYGSGGRYGLRGISVGEPFSPIIDHTDENIVSTNISKALKIEKGLDIDKEDPDLPENIRWRLACSFYPSELDQFSTANAFEERIRQAENIKFFQRDILQVTAADLNGNTLPHSFDAVILSTVLYQMPEYQSIAIENAKELVRDSGLIIVQDFAVKDKTDPTKLDFNVSWFGKNYTYRTFILGERTNWEIMEILRWNNGRCKEVQAGKDLKQALLSLS